MACFAESFFDVQYRSQYPEKTHTNPTAGPLFR